MKSAYKISILFISILVSGLIILAQTASIKPSGSTSAVQKYEYCRLLFSKKWNSYTGGNTTTEIFAQFGNTGQEAAYPNEMRALSKTENYVDALNYLGIRGWELVSVYVDEGDDWSNQIHMFKRKL